MPNALAERLLDQADKLLQALNFAGAAPLVDQALLIEPKNPRARSYGAFIAAHAGQKEAALKRINQALKLAPDAPMVIHDAALVFWICGQRHRACRLWERLNELQPRSAETLWNLAMYHAGEDDAETAGMYFRKVMELAPNKPGLHANLGNALRLSGRIEKAIAFFREGARLFPQKTREASNYLYAMHFDPAYGSEQIHAEHAAWGRALES